MRQDGYGLHAVPIIYRTIFFFCVGLFSQPAIMKTALVVRERCGGRTDGHYALHHDYSYLIVDTTSAMNVIMSRHEWQVAHDACILAALLCAHFPNATTTVRFVLKNLIIPLYTPDEAGGIGAFEAPGCASKRPDAVYRVGWKNSRLIRGMTSAESFGPLAVLVRRFM